MTPPRGRGNCPSSLSSPSPRTLPGPVAYKIANSCCDHGLPRPQGPGGKRAKGSLERKLLITYLPQAASKETSPHKSFHKHLAGSQESVHGSHPAIRRLLTSKLRPGSRSLCQIPLLPSFRTTSPSPAPGPSAPRVGVSCLAALASLQAPAPSFCWVLFPWKPAPYQPQLLGFQGALLGCCADLNPTKISEGHPTRPGLKRRSQAHSPLCSTATLIRGCWCLSGWGSSRGK